MIRQLLRRHTYVGIEIYHRTYQVRDPETGKVATFQRPRNQWKVRRSRPPDRPLEPLQGGAARLEATGPPTTRAGAGGRRPRPISTRRDWSGPSAGRAGRTWCSATRGSTPATFRERPTGKKGCNNRGYKSVRIVEEAVLAELHARVFTAGFLGPCWRRRIATWRRRPSTAQDAAPLKAGSARSGRRGPPGRRWLDKRARGPRGGGPQGRQHERRLQEMPGRLAEQEAAERARAAPARRRPTWNVPGRPPGRARAGRGPGGPAPYISPLMLSDLETPNSGEARARAD